MQELKTKSRVQINSVVGETVMKEKSDRGESNVESRIIGSTQRNEDYGIRRQGGNKEGSTIEEKVIAKLMRKGKKEKAELILRTALKKVEQEVLKKEATLQIGESEKRKQSQGSQGMTVSVGELTKLLEKIVENAKPLVRLKKVRIAGATHQKPVALTKKQAESDAIKRIVTNANARTERSSTLKLAKELEEIYLMVVSNKTLTEVRELHKLAEANKANIALK